MLDVRCGCGAARAGDQRRQQRQDEEGRGGGQRGRDAIGEQLAPVADEAGLSLIELALAFVANHPAVTAAIIGPRTMEQLESQLPGADVALDAAVLDRIDEIVLPGVNLNPADNSYGEQVLKPALLRR